MVVPRAGEPQYRNGKHGKKDGCPTLLYIGETTRKHARSNQPGLKPPHSATVVPQQLLGLDSGGVGGAGLFT
jgi:hypothetical protein